MNKIWLIVQREYSTRVKNKTFLLTTFLAPVAFILFFIVLGFLMNQGSDEVKTIKVVDQQGLLDGVLTTRDNLKAEFTTESLEDLKEAYKDKAFDGILVINPVTSPDIKDYNATYYSDDQLALDETFSIEKAVRKKIRNYKLKALDIDEAKLDIIDTDVSITPQTILNTDKKISEYTTVVSGVLGGVVGYAMFFIILIYGSQVMRSVMEEKINRIVEVLISSVTPFQLMMGKVIGVGLVGLTQIGIWMILLIVISMVAPSLMGIDPASMGAMNGVEGMEAATAQLEGNADKVAIFLNELRSLNWFKIIPLVLFYFFGGYFAYAALFAAVGSAVGEDINEANSLTMPIMIPLVLAVYIGFSAVQAPNGSLAVWSSMIPLLSSIVMPVRLPVDPPFWQIAISVISLILFTVFFVWLAARIYRVGILMYGKKASFKELAKWIFYKG
jgi:ABC-2 type transport system permease protein